MTGRELDPFFAAVVEATEEAVLNSLLQAATVTGRDGHTSAALPASDLSGLLHGGAAVMPDSLPPAALATPAADDPYGWMRDTQLPAVHGYLAAERQYYEHELAPLRGLRDELRQEMTGRVAAAEESVRSAARRVLVLHPYGPGPGVRAVLPGGRA